MGSSHLAMQTPSHTATELAAHPPSHLATDPTNHRIVLHLAFCFLARSHDDGDVSNKKDFSTENFMFQTTISCRKVFFNKRILVFKNFVFKNFVLKNLMLKKFLC